MEKSGICFAHNFQCNCSPTSAPKEATHKLTKYSSNIRLRTAVPHTLQARAAEQPPIRFLINCYFRVQKAESTYQPRREGNTLLQEPAELFTDSVTPPQDFNGIVLQFGLACPDRPEAYCCVVQYKYSQNQVTLQAWWSATFLLLLALCKLGRQYHAEAPRTS